MAEPSEINECDLVEWLAYKTSVPSPTGRGPEGHGEDDSVKRVECQAINPLFLDKTTACWSTVLFRKKKALFPQENYTVAKIEMICVFLIVVDGVLKKNNLPKLD